MLGTIDDFTIARADELFSNAYWRQDKQALYYALGLGPVPVLPDQKSQRVLCVIQDKWYYCEIMVEYFVLIQSVFTNLGRMREGRTIAGEFLKEFANHSFDPIAFCAGLDLMKVHTLVLLHGNGDSIRVKSLKKIIRENKFGWMTIPWFVLLKQTILDTDYSVDVVCAIRQLSEYLGRTRFSSTFNQLKKRAVSEYTSYEEKLLSYEYSDHLVNALKFHISQMLPKELWDAEMKDFLPSNSGGAPQGATREIGRHIWYKYTHMSVDSRLVRVLPGEPRTLFPFPDSLKKLNRVCELCAVPKTATSIRWISKEPPALSYTQHGVQRALVKVLRKTVKNHLDFSDSDRSGRLARRGSLFGDYATIDLSSASDSITWKLVSRIFPSHVRKLLWATRSDYVVLPKVEGVQQTMRMAKFAPMGSATCFPVESVVFLACCLVALDFYNDSTSSIRKTRCLVYGDDMVVEEWLVPYLMKVLEQCHFDCNTSKSFTGQCLNNFREACGEEAYNGFSIKPLRISRNRYQASTLNPGASLSGLIDRYNASVEYFIELSTLYRRRLEQTVYNGRPALYQIGWGGTRLKTTSSPFNRNRFWNADLQRWFVPTLVVKPVMELISEDDNAALARVGLTQSQVEQINLFEALRKQRVCDEIDPWLSEKQNEHNVQWASIIKPALSPEFPWGI